MMGDSSLSEFESRIHALIELTVCSPVDWNSIFKLELIQKRSSFLQAWKVGCRKEKQIELREREIETEKKSNTKMLMRNM